MKTEDQTPLQQSLEHLRANQQRQMRKESSFRTWALRALVVILVVVGGKVFLSLRNYKGDATSGPAAISAQAASQCDVLFQNDPGACACNVYAKGNWTSMQYGPETGCQIWQNGQWVSVTP